MSLTDQQIEQRRKGIGSSDAPAVLGVDPYRGPGDVYLEKRLELAPISTEAIRSGDRLEPILIKYAEEVLGKKIVASVRVASDDGVNAANLDGMVEYDPINEVLTEIVEAKTTGLVDGWGDPKELNTVPDKVLIQTHHQFYVTGAVVAWVPVILARFGLKFEMHRVERDDELAAMVGRRCVDFWRNHVETGVEPGEAPKLDALTRVKRVPGKVVAIDGDLLVAYRAANEIAKGAKKMADQAKAELLASIGDGDGGRSDAGCFTYLEYQRKGYAVKPSSYRQMKEVKGELT